MPEADQGRKTTGLHAAMALLLGLALFAAWGGVVGLTGSAAAQATDGVDISAPPVTVTQWSTQGGDQAQAVTGTVTFGGQPVSGVVLIVGGFRLPTPTDAQGRFVFPVDRNVVKRYPVKVADAESAAIRGNALSAEQRSALVAAEGGIVVHYAVQDVSTAVRPDGAIAVSGTLSFAGGEPPPVLGLYAFRLEGTVKDTAGKPVQGVLVTGKVEDRWMVSDPTDADGHYRAIFWPTPNDPSMEIAVYDGDSGYPVQGGGQVTFEPLKSARMDLTLDRATGTLRAPQPQAVDGAVYDALLAGVAQNGQPVKPVDATWPDAEGHFSMVLPATLAGQRLDWWQTETYYFASGPATPGSPIDLTEWPTALGPRVGWGFGSVDLAAKR